MTRAYIKNAAGDFYVEDGCCITCAVPLDIAPAIFEMDEEQCFVKKQPVSVEELRQTLEAIQCAEFECIRYRGKDRRILQRLVEAGEAAICDDIDAILYKEQCRDHVTFSYNQPSPSVDHIRDLFIEYLNNKKDYDGNPRHRIKLLSSKNTAASLAFAWYEQNFHEVMFSMLDQECLVRLHPSSRNLIHAVTRCLYDWLRHSSGIHNVCFMTEAEFKAGSGGQSTPY